MELKQETEGGRTNVEQAESVERSLRRAMMVGWMDMFPTLRTFAEKSQMQDSPSDDSMVRETRLQPLPREEWPCIDHIETEDGEPVDNVLSEKQMRLLTRPLYASWDTDRPFVALANVGLFYGVDLAPLVPDVLLSMDVRMPENLFPKINRSYFVWKYGKPPNVVIEIVSNKQGREDGEKLKLYADCRISHYVIFDPEHFLSEDTLRVYELRSAKLELCNTTPVVFPDVGLGLTIWPGRFEDIDGEWLRWTDRDGKVILSGQETAITERQRADLETQRADLETQRAEAETRRADQAASENERLLELLRRNNIDPSSEA